MVSVEGQERRSDLFTEHTVERCGRRIHEHDVDTHLSSRRRHLRADPARADHHDASGGADRVTQGPCIVDGAEVVHAVEIRSGDGDGARRRPRGEHDGLERQLETAAEPQAVRQGSIAVAASVITSMSCCS